MPSPGHGSALPGMEDDSPFHAGPPERGQGPSGYYPGAAAAPGQHSSAVAGPRARHSQPSLSKEEYRHALDEQMAQHRHRPGGRQQPQQPSYPYEADEDVPPGGGNLPLKEGRHPNKLSKVRRTWLSRARGVVC